MGKFTTPPREPLKAASSIGDPYDDYLEDTLGYGYDAWDVVTQEEVRRHDELLHGEEALLNSLDTAELDDLQSLAVALAWRRLGHGDRYVEALVRLGQSTQTHPSLSYPDLVMRAVLASARHQRFDDATALLTSYRDRWPDLKTEAHQLEINIALFMTDLERAAALYQALMADIDDLDETALVVLELAEDALRLGHGTTARAWLDDARRLANQANDRALLVDIELFAEHLDEGDPITEGQMAPES